MIQLYATLLAAIFSAGGMCNHNFHNSVAMLFQALHCIGDLIARHPKNVDELASKVLGEEPQVELALNSILRIILRTSSLQEFVNADYVFKNFCEVGTLKHVHHQVLKRM